MTRYVAYDEGPEAAADGAVCSVETLALQEYAALGWEGATAAFKAAPPLPGRSEDTAPADPQCSLEHTYSAKLAVGSVARLGPPQR